MNDIEIKSSKGAFFKQQGGEMPFDITWVV